nr:uncharacterized protein LOC113807922 isoform X1 [Penaeus vannamei]
MAESHSQETAMNAPTQLGTHPGVYNSTCPEHRCVEELHLVCLDGLCKCLMGYSPDSQGGCKSDAISVVVTWISRAIITAFVLFICVVILYLMFSRGSRSPCPTPSLPQARAARLGGVAAGERGERPHLLVRRAPALRGGRPAAADLPGGHVECGESFPSKRGAAGLWRRPRRPGSAPRRPGADLHDGRADPGLRKDVLRLRPPFALRHEATAGTSHSAPPERRAPSHRAAQ